MVKMTVGEQNVVKALKADPTFEDLALGPLAAIDHETILIVLNDQRGKSTFNGRGRGGCA